MSPVTTPRRLRTAIGATAAATLAVTGLVATAAGSDASQTAPTSVTATVRGADSPTAIPGSYVVVLSGNRSPAATRATTQSLATSYDAKVRKQFSASIKGFSASMTPEQAQKMAADERVAFVQQNQKFTVNQDNPPWGLDRTDQRDLPASTAWATAATSRAPSRARTSVWPRA